MKQLAVLGLATVIGCSGQGGGALAGEPAQDPSCQPGSECDPPAEGVYVLGSSYSWDADPEMLDSDPAWQIFCAKSLDYIFHHPDGHCVSSSTPWPDVLDPPARVFGYLSFQPVKGDDSTLDADVAHITYWIAEQPLSSVGVVHTTWPTPAKWEAELHDPRPDHTFTNYSVEYYELLLEELERANPQRTFVSTRVNEMMDYIFHDPASPISFTDLFRDSAGHVSFEIGVYLVHNAFRQAMRQETGVDTTAVGVADDLRAYLDDVIVQHPAW